MQTIFRLCEVPQYLRTSSFYKTISENAANDQEITEIPADKFKRDIEICTVSGCKHLLDTLHYWDSPVLPDSLIDFCMSNWETVKALINEKAEGLSQIKALKTVIDTPVEKRAIAAAASGSTRIMERAAVILKVKFNNVNVAMAAARSGHIECLRYLHETGCKMNDKRICISAAKGGNVECLKFAHEIGCALNAQVCTEAASRGYIACLRYAHEKGCTWDAQVCIQAAKHGKIECLRYAHEKGCAWSNEVCIAAAEHGRLECLRYARENGCEWNRQVCFLSAKNGHIECLRYAHENGCEWDLSLCDVAAEHGQLECLRYAHENGCALAKTTCELAAKAGHLVCLQYACDNHCPWNKLNVCRAAAAGDHFDCLQYALKCKNASLPDENRFITANVCYAAAKAGSIRCLRAAHEAGSDISGSWQGALDSGDAVCLRYAYEHGDTGEHKYSAIKEIFHKLDAIFPTDESTKVKLRACLEYVMSLYIANPDDSVVPSTRKRGRNESFQVDYDEYERLSILNIMNDEYIF